MRGATTVAAGLLIEAAARRTERLELPRFPTAGALGTAVPSVVAKHNKCLAIRRDPRKQENALANTL